MIARPIEYKEVSIWGKPLAFGDSYDRHTSLIWSLESDELTEIERLLGQVQTGLVEELGVSNEAASRAYVDDSGTLVLGGYYTWPSLARAGVFGAVAEAVPFNRRR